METLTRKAGFEALADVHNAINDAGHRFYYTGGGVLYIQTRGSKSQKHYAEKFSAFGEDILQILISDRDAVVRGVTKEDAFALIEEFSERYDAESNLSFSAIFLSPDDNTELDHETMAVLQSGSPWPFAFPSSCSRRISVARTQR
jgi:hypothetical protein